MFVFDVPEIESNKEFNSHPIPELHRTMEDKGKLSISVDIFMLLT